MPTIDLTDEELATVTAVIRRLIEVDKFPRAPRVDRLRSALVKLERSQTSAAELRRVLAAKLTKRQPTTPKGRPRGS
jgi:hypothetical protein